MTVPTWAPGTQYGYGDIVVYESVRYKIIQPHMSQGDWTPPVTPALWGRIQDDQWENHAPYNPPQGCGDYRGQNVHPPDDYSQHQQVDVPHEEQKKNWYDLDDNLKNQLKMGGGLLAGAALLGGGYYAWHEHEEKSEEEKDALTWGAQNWHQDSRARTEGFRNHGPRSPTTWVLVDGRDKIPNSAIMSGRDRDGHPIYIARAFHEHSLQIGKASPGFRQGAAIGYADRVIEFTKFEILIGDSRAIRWVPHSNRLDVQQLGATPVEGGRDANGVPLYVARVRHNDGVHTAKVGECLPCAQLAFNGEEVKINDYEVLCLN